jgi:hypothetical protein
LAVSIAQTWATFQGISPSNGNITQNWVGWFRYEKCSPNGRSLSEACWKVC